MKYLALVVALAYCTPVHADTRGLQPYSGYQLSGACGSPNSADRDFCATYLIGVFDTANAVMAFEKRPRLYCNRPTDVSELLIMYSRYAREGPQVTLNGPAVAAALEFFATYYRCS